LSATADRPRRDATFALLSLRDGRGYFLPLTSPRVAVASLDIYNAQSRRAKVAKHALAIAARLGLCPPPLTRVALGPEAGDAEDARWVLLDEMRSILGSDDLVCAVSMGTPGPDRKPVIQFMDSRGRVLGYAKVGRDERTRALVQREARVLSEWNGVGPRSFLVPALLFSGEVGGCFLCVQSAPDALERPTRPAIGDAHHRFLRDLAARGTRWMPLDQSPFWSELLDRIERSTSPFYRSLLRRAATVLRRRAGHEPIPFHFSHGDFAPWNLKLVGERLYVFDWEYARDQCPVGTDLFHFLVRSAVLLRGWSGARLLGALTEPGPRRAMVEQHLRGFGLDRRWVELLLLAYLVDQLSSQALELDPNGWLTAEMASMISLLVVAEQST
jgi:hypothetical protein